MTTKVRAQPLPPAETLLRSFAPPNWQIVRVGTNELGAVAIYLASADASFRLRLSLPGTFARPSLSSPVGDVFFDQLAGLSPEKAREVATQALGGARTFLLPLLALFPHFLLGNNRNNAADLRRRLSRVLVTRPPWVAESILRLPVDEHDLYLDPPGIAAFLAPHLDVGADGIAGYGLHSIALPPNPRRTSLDLRKCVLTFAPADGTNSFKVQIGALDAITRPFAKAGPVAIGLHEYTHRHTEDDIPVPVASLCAWLAVLIALKLGDTHTMQVPRRVHEIRALAVPDVADDAPSDIDAAGTLHLHLDAECGQSCIFCPIKNVVPPYDDGENELEGLRLRMRAARNKGVTAIQINGLDPLAFSRILELVENIATFGFVHLHLMGPARRFADETFRRALFARAPAETNVVVPLYGATAEVHDDVTGRPGSHAEVFAALAGLLRDVGATRVSLATVITRKNVHEWTSLVAFAHTRGLELFSQPVYPLRANADQAYQAAALPESTIVAEVLRTLDAVPAAQRSAALAALGAVVRHPCIRYHAQKARNHLPVYSAGTSERMQALSAVLRRNNDASPNDNAMGASTLPCAASTECALADVCPREHYTAYVELFGTGEFVAVPK